MERVPFSAEHLTLCTYRVKSLPLYKTFNFSTTGMRADFYLRMNPVALIDNFQNHKSVQWQFKVSALKFNVFNVFNVAR